MAKPSESARQLKALRERAQLSVRGMADAIGMGASSYQHYEARYKRRYLPAELVEALIPPLTARGVAESEILALGAASTAAPAVRTTRRQPSCPVLGYVGAGERVFMFEAAEAAFYPTEAPPGLRDPAGFVVRGESMDPAYRDGDILIIEHRQSSPSTFLNRDCIVQVRDGPLLCKLVRKGSRKDLYHLFSYNRPDALVDQEIESAAPIRWIRRS